MPSPMHPRPRGAADPVEPAHVSVRERLNDYLDGALEAAEAESLEAHLGQCPSCRAFAGSLHYTIELLRQLPRPRLSPLDRDWLVRRVLHAGRER
jgi:anti-sigma factor RsiW